MTYSLDFRTHILSVKADEQLTNKATKARFGVAVSTLQRWENGFEPKTSRCKKPTKIADEKLLQDVEDYPDAFQYERAERLGVSQRGISHALKRLGITRKKRH